METLRVPLFGLPETRQFSETKDQYFKNCYSETIVSGADDPETHVVKRPGMGEKYDKASGEGRGCYEWKGEVYWVVGDFLYKGNTSIGTQPFNTTTGRVTFSEIEGGTPRLVIQDHEANDFFTVETDDTVTEITSNIPGQGTSTQCFGVCQLDGYTFLAQEDRQIFNSDVNAPESWQTSGVVTGTQLNDKAVRIARHLNYVMLFTEYSLEFFYDAGNVDGSPLSRVDGSVMMIGCAAGKSVWGMENSLFWVAQDRAGGKSVMMLDGLNPVTISNKYAERLINEEGKSAAGTSGIYAFGVKIAGHIFYVIQLPSTNRTLVFDLRDKTWSEWTSFDGSSETDFLGVDYAYAAGENLFLDTANGTLYTMDVDIYQDDSQDIKVEFVTDRIDFTTNKMKFLHRLEIIADQPGASSTISMRYSDDDYQTWSTAETVDLNANATYHALGAFQRRAFEFTYADNYPMRLKALEFGLTPGSYAQGNS